MNPGRGFQRVLTVLLLVGVILTLWLRWNLPDVEADSPRQEKIVIVQQAERQAKKASCDGAEKQADRMRTVRVYTKRNLDGNWYCYLYYK